MHRIARRRDSLLKFNILPITVVAGIVAFNVWQIQLERATTVDGSQQRILSRLVGSIVIGALLLVAAQMWRAAGRTSSRMVSGILRGLVWGSLLIAGLMMMALKMSTQV